MAVHFVYRCPYAGPSGKHVAHFPDDTVLSWFQRNWAALRAGDTDAVYPRVDRLMGIAVYGLGSLWERAIEHDLPPPASDRQLRQYLDNYLYVEGMVQCKPHLIQALTDDDDVMLAYFFFDDHFLAEHRDRAAFLLTDGWQLPGGSATTAFKPTVKTSPLRPAARGEGTLYLVTNTFYSSDHLEEMRYSHRIDGLRLPDLARHIARAAPRSGWPFELELARSQVFAPPRKAGRQEKVFLDELRQQPGDEAAWRVYSDWLVDQGEAPVGLTLLRRALGRCAALPMIGVNYDTACSEGLEQGDVEAARAVIAGRLPELRGWDNSPRKSCVHVEEHLAQLCVHIGKTGRHDIWHQWYFFDDRWAAAHPAVADALLAHGRRWDVLSSWKSRSLGMD
jgi:uncharacterized protein (TIGR02996 family)